MVNGRGEPLVFGGQVMKNVAGYDVSRLMAGALGGERVDNAAASAEWLACRDQRLPWFTDTAGGELWRLSVPQTAPVLELPAAPLIEWHGGQRWVHAEPGQGARLREIAAGAGGHATLFRAEGGASPRFHPLPPALLHIHRELKRQFDPAGIFNPGRLYADL
jgi:glycolate oxidase FAD binding subunit